MLESSAGSRATQRMCGNRGWKVKKAPRPGVLRLISRDFDESCVNEQIASYESAQVLQDLTYHIGDSLAETMVWT